MTVFNSIVIDLEVKLWGYVIMQIEDPGGGVAALDRAGWGSPLQEAETCRMRERESRTQVMGRTWYYGQRKQHRQRP